MLCFTEKGINFIIMKIEFKEFIPKEFDDNSRVWIYQASRSFTGEEISNISERLNAFNQQWHSHGSSVHSFVHLFFGWFIVLMADEREVAVGGCSTDSSTRFIRALEKEFGVELFNRQVMAFFINDSVVTIPLSNVNKAIEDETITGDTLYFNNTILTKKDLLEKWVIPVKNSWLASRIPNFTPIPKQR